jgi:hypothetical protein
MKIILEKLKELPDAKHPNNIEIGFIKIGEFLSEPKVNRPFYVGPSWRTSKVTEIIDSNTFKTMNSIYKFKTFSYEK